MSFVKVESREVDVEKERSTTSPLVFYTEHLAEQEESPARFLPLNSIIE